LSLYAAPQAARPVEYPFDPHTIRIGSEEN
jgi:hypothetical protein